ncbi:MAG: hypothetical protein JNJ82_18940 [Opitutaceae bacterium]|nr:hypothetical protein [Opitutaceae bacterium]
MPIKAKETRTSAEEAPLQFRTNPEVQKRLNAYKEANSNDVAYFQRVVAEAPARAVDMLVLKDMQRHEADMRLIQRQIPQAKAFYDAQSQEVRSRIDQRLNEVHPYYKDKAFVSEVLREMQRHNRQVLSSPKAGVSMAVG